MFFDKEYSEKDIIEMIRTTAPSLENLTISSYEADSAMKIYSLLLEIDNEEIPRLESLVFSEVYGWEAEHINKLKEIFDKCPSIKSLEFKSCPLTVEIIEHISEKFIKNSNLKSLCINATEFYDDKAIRVIGNDLMNIDCKLESLSFEDTILNETQILLLSEALEKNNSLKSLSLCNAHLKLSGVKFIAEALKKNNKLELLNLSDNKLENSAIELVLDAFKENKILKSLNLSLNQLNRSIIEFILNGLKDNNTFELLDLSENELKSEDIVDLIEGLVKQETKLKKLRISFSYDKKRRTEKLEKYLEGKIDKNKLPFALILE